MIAPRKYHHDRAEVEPAGGAGVVEAAQETHGERVEQARDGRAVACGAQPALQAHHHHRVARRERADALDGHAVFGKVGAQLGGPEQVQVARQIPAEPVIGEQARLQAVGVGQAQHQHAAGAQQAGQLGQHGARLVDVLKHIPHGDRVEACGG
jgi:hypothetical protein